MTLVGLLNFSHGAPKMLNCGARDKSAQGTLNGMAPAIDWGLVSDQHL